MPQCFWRNIIRIFVEYLVDSGCRQLLALPADKEIRAVRVALFEILTQSIHDFIIDVY